MDTKKIIAQMKRECIKDALQFVSKERGKVSILLAGCTHRANPKWPSIHDKIDIVSFIAGIEPSTENGYGRAFLITNLYEKTKGTLRVHPEYLREVGKFGKREAGELVWQLKNWGYIPLVLPLKKVLKMAENPVVGQFEIPRRLY
jgi:hypothetical protein